MTIQHLRVEPASGDVRRARLAALLAHARKHDGVFDSAEATALGVDRFNAARLFASGHLEEMFEGVFRVAGAPDSWRSRARAAVLAGGNPCGLTHRSARHVWVIPGGARAPIAVACHRWDRTHYAGLEVHEMTGLDDTDLTEHHGLTVVVAPLALLQIAGERWTTVDDVERAVYAARRRGHVSNASVQEYLYRRARRGRPGVRKLRAAIERAAQHARPTDSEMETELLQAMRRQGLPELVLQFVLRDDDGKFIARVDAALPDWRILLEYQSDQEHLDGVDPQRDNAPRLWAQYGYWMVPVHSADLRDGGVQLAKTIRGARDALREGLRPASPPCRFRSVVALVRRSGRLRWRRSGVLALGTRGRLRRGPRAGSRATASR